MRRLEVEGFPWESTDVDEALPPVCLRRLTDLESVEVRGDAAALG